MNGKKSDTFEIKVSKIEIKSANKQENATILTAITRGGEWWPQEFVVLLYFWCCRNLRFFYQGFFLVIKVETMMGFPFFEVSVLFSFFFNCKHDWAYCLKIRVGYIFYCGPFTGLGYLYFLELNLILWSTWMGLKVMIRSTLWINECLCFGYTIE